MAGSAFSNEDAVSRNRVGPADITCTCTPIARMITHAPSMSVLALTKPHLPSTSLEAAFSAVMKPHLRESTHRGDTDDG